MPTLLYSKIGTFVWLCAQMIGEFRGHSGHINCMVWSSKGSILYVGDSMGILGTWQKKKGVWKLKRKTDFMNVSEDHKINNNGSVICSHGNLIFSDRASPWYRLACIQMVVKCYYTPSKES